MKSIIEREATVENNSDMEVKVTQKLYSSWAGRIKAFYPEVEDCLSLTEQNLRRPEELPCSLKCVPSWII